MKPIIPSDDRLLALSIDELADHSKLPEKLSIKNIGELMHEKHKDRKNLYSRLVQDVKKKQLKCTGIKAYKLPEIRFDELERIGAEEFTKAAEKDLLDAVDPPEWFIHRDEFRRYLIAIDHWPVLNCKLANWWDEHPLNQSLNTGNSMSHFLTFRESLPPPPEKLQIVAAGKVTNLTHWLLLDTWTPEIGAYLINGIVPSTVGVYPNEKVANLSDIKPIDPVHRMQHVQHVLTLWNSQINPPEKVTPIDFIQWCNSKKIDAGWITNADEWEVYTTAKLNNYPPVDWTFQLSLPLWDETESACFIMQGVTKLQYEKKTLDDEKLNLINWFKESIKGEAIKGNIPHKVKDGVFYFVPNTAIAWAVGKHFTVIPILQDFIEGSIQYKAKLAGKTFKLEKLSESEKDYYYNLAVWSWVDAIYILQDYKPIFQLNDERVIKDFSDTAIYFRQSIDLGNIGKEHITDGLRTFIDSPTNWQTFWQSINKPKSQAKTLTNNMAVIQNGKRNFIKKEYYRLLEVIEILGCTVDDLIHLAANKKLLISVIPFRDIGKKSNSGINLKLLDSKFWQIIERNEPQVFENWNGDEGIKVIEAKEFFPISDNYVISQSELEKLQQYILANIDNAKNSTFKSEALADDGAVKPKSEQATELKQKARGLGEKWMNQQRNEGKDPGVIDIAKHVEAEFKKLDIRGKRGDYLIWETIKKEFLTGITGKSPNGKGLKKRKQTGDSPV